MRQVIKDAKLTYSDINKVLLVGGSTRIPAVEAMVQQYNDLYVNKK